MTSKIDVTITATGEAFGFALERKREWFGPFEFDQFWMPLPSVYPTGTRGGANFRPIVDCWWAGCRQNSTHLDPFVRETYLLARLLPRTRSKGAPRIVADAALRKPGRQVVAELERLLTGGPATERDEAAFRDTAAGALGPSAYADEDRARYLEAVRELFDDGRRGLLLSDGEAAVEAVEARWSDWMKRYGRRNGHEEQKRLLDVLSYESRAALHQCYSAVWTWLIVGLRREHGITDEAALFHEFWHLQHRGPAEGTDEDDCHLFSGHVFALHPAAATFVRTGTGRNLIGEYLGDPAPGRAWRNVLGGLAVAAFHYAQRRDDGPRRRRQPPRSAQSSAVVPVPSRARRAPSAPEEDGGVSAE